MLIDLTKYWKLILNNRNIGLEIRSIRIDGQDLKNLYETSWPDIG